MKEVTKPFKTDDDYVVICQGKWYRFPTPDEAWDFYYERKEREVVLC